MTWERKPDIQLNNVNIYPDHKDAPTIKLWLDEKGVDPAGISHLVIRVTSGFGGTWYSVFSSEPQVRLEPDLSDLPGGNRKLDNKLRHLAMFLLTDATVLDQQIAAIADAELGL